MEFYCFPMKIMQTILAKHWASMTYLLVIYGKKYSRMVQVKFVEDKQTTSLQIF